MTGLNFLGMGAGGAVVGTGDRVQVFDWGRRACLDSVASQFEEIRDGFEPDYSQFREFETLPSEFPRLSDYEYFYLINLDHEVLTLNHSIHWKLGDITRQDELWLRAIADSIYPNKPTISLDDSESITKAVTVHGMNNLRTVSTTRSSGGLN